MGTNYYAYEKEVCPHCQREWPSLHIGKSSLGWKFLFARYEDQGLTSARSWYEFLERTNARILDEYDRPETLEGLKALVASKQNGAWQRTSPDGFFGERMHEDLDDEGYRISRHWDFS